jgi:hypothetical protein
MLKPIEIFRIRLFRATNQESVREMVQTANEPFFKHLQNKFSSDTKLGVWRELANVNFLFGVGERRRTSPDPESVAGGRFNRNLFGS